MCGYRPVYAPGNTVVNRTSPELSAAWTPRRYVSLVAPCEYIEYKPSALQCQMYTAAPLRGWHVFASTTVRSTVRGTPRATPAPMRLVRMSWRTTPFWLSTLGPFEPSPGYGPAVSVGIFEQPASAVEPCVPVVCPRVDAVVSEVPPFPRARPALPSSPHPARNAAAPRPPS